MVAGTSKRRPAGRGSRRAGRGKDSWSSGKDTRLSRKKAASIVGRPDRLGVGCKSILSDTKGLGPCRKEAGSRVRGAVAGVYIPGACPGKGKQATPDDGRERQKQRLAWQPQQERPQEATLAPYGSSLHALVCTRGGHTMESSSGKSTNGSSRSSDSRSGSGGSSGSTGGGLTLVGPRRRGSRSHSMRRTASCPMPTGKLGDSQGHQHGVSAAETPSAPPTAEAESTLNPLGRELDGEVEGTADGSTRLVYEAVDDLLSRLPPSLEDVTRAGERVCGGDKAREALHGYGDTSRETNARDTRSFSLPDLFASSGRGCHIDGITGRSKQDSPVHKSSHRDTVRRRKTGKAKSEEIDRAARQAGQAHARLIKTRKGKPLQCLSGSHPVSSRICRGLGSGAPLTTMASSRTISARNGKLGGHEASSLLQQAFAYAERVAREELEEDEKQRRRQRKRVAWGSGKPGVEDSGKSDGLSERVGYGEPGSGRCENPSAFLGKKSGSGICDSHGKTTEPQSEDWVRGLPKPAFSRQESLSAPAYDFRRGQRRQVCPSPRNVNAGEHLRARAPHKARLTVTKGEKWTAPVRATSACEQKERPQWESRTTEQARIPSDSRRESDLDRRPPPLTTAELVERFQSGTAIAELRAELEESRARMRRSAQGIEQVASEWRHHQQQDIGLYVP